MKPRICYILPTYDPATGSHFFHLYELLRRSSQELDIFLIIERAKTCPSDLPLGVYCQKFSWPPFRLAELFFMVLRERMRGRRNFYSHYSFFGGLVSWFVARIFGGRAYYWNAGMPWLYRRSFFEEAVFRFVLRNTILVTGTAGLAAEYSRRYGLDKTHIRTIPNWVNLMRFGNDYDRSHIRKGLGISTGQRIVLFVHHLSKRKGAHFIIPVARSVTEKLKNAIFLVVGAGPEYEGLKFEVKSLKLDDRILLVGEAPNRDMHKYFQAADVFFMPSEEEGFPHVLLEAMAAGVPYVASDVGAVREITPLVLHDYIVASGDTEKFAEKIVSLLNMSEHDIGNISEEEKGWVKKYDIEAVLPRFAELFTDQ